MTISIRQATVEDLPACNRIWRIALDGYLQPMGFPALPEDNPSVRRLHGHTRATDPDRFLVAERRDGSVDPRLVAFGSAVERGPMWFLSMLFVEPGEQTRGLGRDLLQALLPEPRGGRILATCADSAQPISNGLYAAHGIVPRMPMLNLVGRPRPGARWPALPDHVRAERVTDTAAWLVDPEARALDRELLGFEHPQDHAFVIDEPRHLFAYRDSSGALAGYGYAGEIGRLGPIAAREPVLLAPILGHLVTNVVPRGASSVWLPGAAGDAISAAIVAGLRMEGFPILVCWSAPFADLTRYVPTSPGLI